MKAKEMVMLLFIIFFISSVSASIIIGSTNEIYNKGDTISTTATVNSNIETEGLFNTFLICGGIEKEVVPKQYLDIGANSEKQIELNLKLISSLIGDQKGNCYLKTTFEEFTATSNSLTISELINLESTSSQEEVEPEEIITIEGTAIKENSQYSEGEIDLTVEGLSISQKTTITNGKFKFEFSLPKETAAKTYSMKFSAYEKDKQGLITNQGTFSKSIKVQQVPTNLEIAFETSEVQPGTNLKVKGILHDQTGVSIPSKVIISIKDDSNKILEQKELNTDEFLDYSISATEAPSEWRIYAVSNKLTSEAKFTILEKKSVDIQLYNKTVEVTNTGNVIYNEPVSVKIGDEDVEMALDLNVGESKKYVLMAPDGNYNIEIATGEGSIISGMATLTGKAVGAKESSSRIVSVIKHPIVWIFIILVLAVVIFFIYRKVSRKKFKIDSKSKKNSNEQPKMKPTQLRKNSLIKSMSPAHLSLSIKGEKQKSDVVCLKIKNLKDIEGKKSGAEETLQKIVDLAEANKTSTYENGDHIFFILAPLKTRTFKNEKVAVDIAQKAKTFLDHHNKLFRQKIHYGISIHTGNTVVKEQDNKFEFMSMGTLITTLKKISSISQGEILLSKDFKEKSMSIVKPEKQTRSGVDVYTIKSVKEDNQDNKKFISNFIKRLEHKS